MASENASHAADGGNGQAKTGVPSDLTTAVPYGRTDERTNARHQDQGDQSRVSEHGSNPVDNRLAPLKMLTVRQPWASAIMLVEAPKTIENRTWATRVRGTIGIHAGQSIDRRAYGYGGDLDLVALSEAKRLAGFVLGTVGLVGCHRQDDDHCQFIGCRRNMWAQFSDDPVHPIWHWELVEPRPLITPIRAKGALQFWEPTPSVAHLMETGEYQ